MKPPPPEGYIHNGRVAWGMPRRIGVNLLAGVYRCPLGWEIAPGLDGSWEANPAGLIERKALPPGEVSAPPFTEAKVVRKVNRMAALVRRELLLENGDGEQEEV